MSDPRRYDMPTRVTPLASDAVNVSSPVPSVPTDAQPGRQAPDGPATDQTRPEPAAEARPESAGTDNVQVGGYADATLNANTQQEGEH
jgi:hypothetical protein